MSGTARYHRHLALPGWDQARLRDATLVIAGLGALGNALTQSLGLAGVGRLILCDMDGIEESNLSRAPLFTAANLGRLKVEAARDGLARNEGRPDRLEFGLGLAELRDARLVSGCIAFPSAGRVRKRGSPSASRSASRPPCRPCMRGRPGPAPPRRSTNSGNASGT